MCDSGHTLDHPGLLQLAMKYPACILKPSVAMEQRMCIRICLHSPVEGFINKRIIVSFTDSVGNNTSVTEIQDGAEVYFVYVSTLIPFEFCDIRTPFLVWPVSVKLSV